MVDLDWKMKMLTCKSPNKSPRGSAKLTLPTLSIRAGELSPALDSACSSYEHYLRLPELKKLWTTKEFPEWKNESVLRPALQGLEITFRFVSTVLSDPRPYSNTKEWRRRLESLATNQIKLIALICEEDNEEETRGTGPVIDLSSIEGVVDSSLEVSVLPGKGSSVSRDSQDSLLPRLNTWKKSHEVAQNIMYSIECEMMKCPYTLGLGEPNLRGKPSLDYDRICKPAKLHFLKKSPSDSMNLENFENKIVYAIHQILESWVRFSKKLLDRIEENIDSKKFEKASSDCWILERTWKLMEEIEDLHMMTDPDDFLLLKDQLAIKTESESESFCFRSRGLVEITKRSKDLRQKVPSILGVEVDPKGGPRIQESAMSLYRKKNEFEKIHLLQAMQGIESGLKRFYYAYKQLIVFVMGSVEAKGNRAFVGFDSGDSLAQIFLEPTYFPSLDAAKTFLGDYWSRDEGRFSPERRIRT